MHSTCASALPLISARRYPGATNPTSSGSVNVTYCIFGSHKSLLLTVAMASTSALTYRLRGCPATADEAALRGGLAQALGDVRPEDIYIQSLATAIGSWERSPTKTATLRFAKLPSVVGIQTTKEWKIEGHGLHGTLILDTHFLGLTPLNETQAHEHRFE